MGTESFSLDAQGPFAHRWNGLGEPGATTRSDTTAARRNGTKIRPERAYSRLRRIVKKTAWERLYCSASRCPVLGPPASRGGSGLSVTRLWQRPFGLLRGEGGSTLMAKAQHSLKHAMERARCLLPH